MPTATYTPIATQTLGSAAASITFSSIPSTYTDLRLVFTFVGTLGSATPQIRFNGDTANNYSDTDLQGTGTSATSNNNVGTSFGMSLYGSLFGVSTTIPTLATVDIFSYAGSTNKTALGTMSSDNNGSGTIDVAVGLWRSTAAITSVTIFTATSTFAAGMIATLWGI